MGLGVRGLWRRSQDLGRGGKRSEGWKLRHMHIFDSLCLLLIEVIGRVSFASIDGHPPKSPKPETLHLSTRLKPVAFGRGAKLSLASFESFGSCGLGSREF